MAWRLGLAGLIHEWHVVVFRFSHWRMGLFVIKEIGLAKNCLVWYLHLYPIYMGFVFMVYDT